MKIPIVIMCCGLLLSVTLKAPFQSAQEAQLAFNRIAASSDKEAKRTQAAQIVKEAVDTFSKTGTPIVESMVARFHTYYGCPYHVCLEERIAILATENQRQIQELERVHEDMARMAHSEEDSAKRIVQLLSKQEKDAQEMRRLCLGWVRGLRSDTKSLDVSDKHLTAQPDNLQRFTALTSLNMNQNTLITFDGSGLSTLTTLVLNHNRIASLQGLQQLINLKYLFLNDNELTSEQLQGLSELINLTYLYLSKNKCTSLPSLNKLIKLGILDVSYNPLNGLPALNELVSLNVFVVSSEQREFLQDARLSSKVKVTIRDLAE